MFEISDMLSSSAHGLGHVKVVVVVDLSFGVGDRSRAGPPALANFLYAFSRKNPRDESQDR
jgi:hypothetical protein